RSGPVEDMQDAGFAGDRGRGGERRFEIAAGGAVAGPRRAQERDRDGSRLLAAEQRQDGERAGRGGQEGPAERDRDGEGGERSEDAAGAAHDGGGVRGSGTAGSGGGDDATGCTADHPRRAGEFVPAGQ